jgi:hypothetical protein
MRLIMILGGVGASRRLLSLMRGQCSDHGDQDESGSLGFVGPEGHACDKKRKREKESEHRDGETRD